MQMAKTTNSNKTTRNKTTAEKKTRAGSATAAHKTADRGSTSKARVSRKTTPPKSTADSTPRRASRPDPLAAKAREVEHLLEFVDGTSFAGDEREAADELSAVDQHPSDMAGMTLQREVDYTVKEVLVDEERQIQEALRRKQEGTYGICANCGHKIPKARLDARPEATLCIDCQRLQESSRP